MSDTGAKTRDRGRPPAAQDRRLFIGGLLADVTEAELREAAEVCLGPTGLVTKYPGRTYGFIVLKDQIAFEMSLSGMAEIAVRGRRARIGVAVRRCGD
jgi:hypothetical protein